MVAVMVDYEGKTEKIEAYMVEVQKYDETSAPLYDETSAPVYKKALDANNKPKYLQAVDEFGSLVYSEFEYEQLTYEDGSLVWAQKVDENGKPVFKNGKPVYDTPVNGVGGTPVWNYDVIKTVPVDPENPNSGVKPVYNTKSDPVYLQMRDDFTATQVGVPSEWIRFDYGLHILANGSYYEFDTDDYKTPVLYDEEDDDYALFRDAEGNVLWTDIHYVLIDEEQKDIEVALAGDVYDAKKFVWHIKPIEFQKDWVNIGFDMMTGPTLSVVVPAGDTEYYKVLAPAEDYLILPLEGEWPEEYEETWPFDGQYYSVPDVGFSVFFPYGANFTGVAYFTDISAGYNYGMPLVVNVDTLEVTDSLALEDLKKAVHFYPMDRFPQFQSFTIDDFFITVENGDGEIVIFQDNVVRNILASDWYTITVTGNIVNGYYGMLYGSFFIDKEASNAEFTEFSTEDVDGGVAITGYTGNGGDIIIPDYIGGKKVVAIADKAFANNKSITSVTMGDNVRTIGMKAFYGCSKMKSVEFSDSVKVISYYAFYGCKNLEKVVFGNGLKAVRTNAFSVDFLVGFSAQDMAGQAIIDYGKKSAPSPEIEWTPVYANYLDGNEKTQYNAGALAGKTFFLGETDKVLVGPIDIDILPLIASELEDGEAGNDVVAGNDGMEKEKPVNIDDKR